MLPRLAALALLPLALPATASASETFKDRVLTGKVAARAAQAGTTARYPTADGLTISVTAADPAVAQRYATLVGTLPHGSELSSLRIVVVPAARIAEECGGSDDDGILACYGSGDRTMIVPDAQVESSSVSVDYVIAHEYGHHIAANRSNAPLQALDFGPKRWSSYELVCSNTMDGRLAPGDEGDGYFANPGEAWAEAYARLVFPTEAWRFTKVLRPTQGSLLAAMADVTQPWRQRTKTEFTGSGTRSFKLPLTLDGAFTLDLAAPAASRYQLVVKSGGRVVERTMSGRIHFRIACRDRRTENLSISVVRRGGTAAPYTLTARYAG